MHFQKQDLHYTYYEWDEDQVHMYTGQPSRRVFNKYDGNQVLFLINFYASLSNRFTIAEGRQIEHRILTELPGEIKSELSVYNWLRNTIFLEEAI